MNLDAKPEAITFDPAKTAVIVVDMQNDFGSKVGMFDRAGIDISGIQKAVGPTARVLAAARKSGGSLSRAPLGRLGDERCNPKRRTFARPERAHRLFAFIQVQAPRDNGGR